MVIIPPSKLPFKEVGQYLSPANSAMEVCAGSKNYIVLQIIFFFCYKTFFF